jgi:DNA-binding response OmpR family regulator
LSSAQKKTILLVDDDATLLREARTHLEKLGYKVETAEDGVSGLARARTMELDLLVLDINFPDGKAGRARALDGIEVLRMLRDSNNVPVLMLSATNISSVKVMALALGADDYVAKPFDFQELGARIEAILRRGRDVAQADKVLNFQRLRLDPGERRVWKDNVIIDLTGVEFDLLYTLARRPLHVFTREKLLESAWKESSFSIPKVVDVHVGHLRKKIEDNPDAPSILVTVRGTGYRFEDTPV